MIPSWHSLDGKSENYHKNLKVELMPIILVEDLSKVYPVAIKEPGLKGTLRHFLAGIIAM